jgi:TrpR-related protein YerC/YecD
MQYPDKHDKELIKAFSTLETEKEIEHFLRDLLTIAEIKEFSKRLRIAKELWTSEKSYLEIAKEVETSTTTVTRVAQWLFKEGLNGYQAVLKKLYPKSK